MIKNIITYLHITTWVATTIAAILLCSLAFAQEAPETGEERNTATSNSDQETIESLIRSAIAQGFDITVDGSSAPVDPDDPVAMQKITQELMSGNKKIQIKNGDDKYIGVSLSIFSIMIQLVEADIKYSAEGAKFSGDIKDGDQYSLGKLAKTADDLLNGKPFTFEYEKDENDRPMRRKVTAYPITGNNPSEDRDPSGPTTEPTKSHNTGIPKLLVGDPTCDDLFILEAQKQIVSFVPEGGFSAHIMVLGKDGAQQARFTLPPLPYALAVRPDFAFGDVDNDGVSDILILRSDPGKKLNEIHIFSPKDQSTRVINTYPLDNAVHSGMVLGDIDADGYQDIVLGSSLLSREAKVSVINIRNIEPTLMRSWTITFPEGNAEVNASGPLVYPTLADVNNDGKTEIVIPSLDNKGFMDLGISTSGRIDWPIYLHDAQRTACLTDIK